MRETIYKIVMKLLERFGLSHLLPSVILPLPTRIENNDHPTPEVPPRNVILDQVKREILALVPGKIGSVQGIDVLLWDNKDNNRKARSMSKPELWIKVTEAAKQSGIIAITISSLVRSIGTHSTGRAMDIACYKLKAGGWIPYKRGYADHDRQILEQFESSLIAQDSIEAIWSPWHMSAKARMDQVYNHAKFEGIGKDKSGTILDKFPALSHVYGDTDDYSDFCTAAKRKYPTLTKFVTLRQAYWHACHHHHLHVMINEYIA